MIDLLQSGLPMGMDFHGKRWLAIYRVRGTEESIKSGIVFYIAVPMDAVVETDPGVFPAPCSMIFVKEGA